MPRRPVTLPLVLPPRDDRTPAYQWLYGAIRREIAAGQLGAGLRCRPPAIWRGSTRCRAALSSPRSRCFARRLRRGPHRLRYACHRRVAADRRPPRGPDSPARRPPPLDVACRSPAGGFSPSISTPAPPAAPSAPTSRRSISSRRLSGRSSPAGVSAVPPPISSGVRPAGLSAAPGGRRRLPGHLARVRASRSRSRSCRACRKRSTWSRGCSSIPAIACAWRIRATSAPRSCSRRSVPGSRACRSMTKAWWCPGRTRNVWLAYVTPAHQFPLGVTMSLARRLALLDLGADSPAR